MKLSKCFWYVLKSQPLSVNNWLPSANLAEYLVDLDEIFHSLQRADTSIKSRSFKYPNIPQQTSVGRDIFDIYLKQAHFLSTDE